VFPHSRAPPELAERSFVQISDVHLDYPMCTSTPAVVAVGKRNSPIVGRITDAAQIGRYVVWQCRSTNGP